MALKQVNVLRFESVYYQDRSFVVFFSTQSGMRPCMTMWPQNTHGLVFPISPSYSFVPIDSPQSIGCRESSKTIGRSDLPVY